MLNLYCDKAQSLLNELKYEGKFEVYDPIYIATRYGDDYSPSTIYTLLLYLSNEALLINPANNEKFIPIEVANEFGWMLLDQKTDIKDISMLDLNSFIINK